MTIKYFTLSSSIVVGFIGFSLPARSQDSCISTMAEVEHTITTGRNLTVFASTVDIKNDYRGFPEGRNYEVNFVIDGQNASAVIKSKEFLKILTSKLINNCSSLGAVGYSSNQIGIGLEFALFNDGSIRPFKCAANKMTWHDVDKMNWGESSCISRKSRL